MLAYKTFGVVGGDLRQAHIANQLARMGKTTHALLLEQNDALSAILREQKTPVEILRECDTVILPMPLTSDDTTVHSPFSDKKLELETLFSLLSPEQAIFAGRVSEKAQKQAAAHGLVISDYLEREELALQNAAITAEGAVSIAIDQMPTALMGARVLIIGHGRIARALLRILPSFGVKLSACARKFADLAEISAQGCCAVQISELAEAAQNADLIINTVPSLLITREILSEMSGDTLIIDLASKPGGVDG